MHIKPNKNKSNKKPKKSNDRQEYKPKKSKKKDNMLRNWQEKSLKRLTEKLQIVKLQKHHTSFTVSLWIAL